MKPLLALSCLLILLFGCRAAAAADTDESLLSTGLRLRLSGVAQVVIDPDVLDLNLLSTQVVVDANTRPEVFEQLKSQLQPRGLSVHDQDGIVWITKSDAESDLSQQIALIVNSKNYQQLAGALAVEARRNPDSRLKKLAEMAKFMADQSQLPSRTRKLIEEKTKKIKSLQFMQRNAASGSSLSPPDPGRASALESDIEQERNDIRTFYDGLYDRFLASKFDPAEPASAPPPVFATQTIIPAVLFERIAFDSQLFYAESMESLLRASTELAFAKADQKDTAALRSAIENINKMQMANKELLAEYTALLEKAGLLSGSASEKDGAGSTIGIEAANRLFNSFGDTREAVRAAIGNNIMGQLEVLALGLQKGDPAYLKTIAPSDLFLFGVKETEYARQSLGDGGFDLRPYLNGSEHGRLGAVTGLVARKGLGGETSIISVKLEKRKVSTNSSKRTLQNLFGSSDKLVALNTTADVAVVDEMLIGKGGAVAMSDSAYLGGGGFIGSVGEALDLVKNSYDPALFKSSIEVGLDSNYDIRIAGDSGGVALALAALSSVRSQPVDRRLMVTGAVRQFGDVKSVGSVYDKGIAAIKSGALVLLAPQPNLGELLNLPAEKLVTRHTITLNRFKDAASIAGLDASADNKDALKAIYLYNYALAAVGAGKLPEALALCNEAASVHPDHISAQLLRAVLAASGIAASPKSVVAKLFDAATDAANTLTNPPTVIRTGSTSSAPSEAPSIMSVVVPDYTVNAASGEEAFDILNDKVKAACGQPANITIRTKNEFFSTPFINLSVQGKTFEEILKELCSLCEAMFKKTESSIVVDSIRPAAAPSSPPVGKATQSTIAAQSQQTTAELKSALNSASKAQVRDYFGGRKPDGVIGENMWAYAGRWSDLDSGVVFTKVVFSFYNESVSNIFFDD